MKDIHQERLLILDFGSQYTQLIARRLREIGVYCEIFPWDVAPDRIRDFSPKGLILSGGPESTIGAEAPAIPTVVFELEIPVLGICYGMQAMAMHFGGDVENMGLSEFGPAVVQSQEDNPLLKAFVNVGDSVNVWMSHGDRVEQLPTGFSCIAASDNAPIAAMADTSRH